MNAADWTGRVVMVTGGAGSVGRVIVERLARQGATVIINCFHSYAAGKELVARLRADGHDVQLLRASVARKSQVEAAFRTVADEHGRLDLLVNNAATGAFVRFDDITEDLLDRTFGTNVKGPLWCARYARELLAASQGAIVNVSSLGATTTPANYLPVGVSKAALEALTRYLAAEFAPDGIRVNAASCGLIDNEVGRAFPDFDGVRANTVGATPLGRLARPEDLAEVVLFLGSPAAGWITGQTILADGGLTLLHAAMSPPQPDTGAQAAESALEPAVVTAPAPVGTPVVPAPGAEDDDAIAVVGMGLALPGASSPDEFWRLLTEGAELFVEAPADRWKMDHFHDEDRSAPDKSYQRRSGFITDFRPHGALVADGLADADGASTLDHTTLWLRHALHQALEPVRRGPDDRYSFCVGYTPDGSQHLEEAFVLRTALDVLAEDGPEVLNGPVADALRGRFARGDDQCAAFLPHRVGRDAMAGVLPPSTRLHMVDTACSSSLYAVDLGVRDLLAGRTDIAVCGGSFALTPSGSVLFAKLGGLSAGGAVRALDAGADGVLFSDGAGLIVLKRLSRARADGDTVLGVLEAIGLSADGKGKAVYAPSRVGQATAVRRAFARSGLEPSDVDWIVAHATGTPAGDEAEFAGLRAAYAGSPTLVTSNKSLIGHSGWAAGVVSLIHVLLAMRHGEIPAQYRFERLPDALAAEPGDLRVPAASVAWPNDAVRPRRAAVSSFGFGGTNAHLILAEDHPAAGRRGPLGRSGPVADDIVVVGWSAQLPGEPDAAAVAAWAGGDGPAPQPSFGDTYPIPPFTRLRMPPPTARATDRTQLMIVRALQSLDERVRDFCLARGETAGVVVGHTGPTRNALLFKTRAYLDDIGHLVDGVGDAESTGKFLRRLTEHATAAVAAPTEDAFPGEMPNVIAARLSNYFDLRGLNITVDAGEASLLEAFDVASAYLAFGEIDVALVAGVNGNSLPGWHALLGDTVTRAAGPDGVGEAAFLFALTRRSLAAAAGLPVLATVESVDAVDISERTAS